MKTFSLDKLQALCEQGHWAEAHTEADNIAWICRRNDEIINPRFYLRKPPPCRAGPSRRIHGVLCRLSRHRIIDGAYAHDLAARMARKWSGNSGNTMRSFDFLHALGRYWRGDWRRDHMEEYRDLTKLARENKWQWCDLKRHAQQARDRKQHQLMLRNVDLIETREVLRDLNRTIREQRAAA